MHTEKQIENYLKRQFEKIGAIVLKFTSPGTSGVPDRIILLQGGTTLFVEVKCKTGKLAPLQKYWIDKINKHYHEAHVVWSYEDVDALIEHVQGVLF